MTILDDEPRLRAAAGGIVDSLSAEGLAERVVYTDTRVGRDYWVLATVGAFRKPVLAVAVLGYPEQVGVWSYTLVRQGRLDAASMEAYFRAFSAAGIGLVALNPNFFEPDIEGDTFFYQLDRVAADLGSGQRLGLIGFSMGGRIVVEFLQRRPDLHPHVAGLVLIDPTLPNRLTVSGIRNVLDESTLLIASAGAQSSPGDVASVLLGIPKVSFAGIHGEMPNKALVNLVDFFLRN